MKKQEFDDLFVELKQKIVPNSEQEMIERLSHYTKDPERMKLEEVMVYLQIESIKYTNDLVYNLLLETVVERD